MKYISIAKLCSSFYVSKKNISNSQVTHYWTNQMVKFELSIVWPCQWLLHAWNKTHSCIVLQNTFIIGVVNIECQSNAVNFPLMLKKCFDCSCFEYMCLSPWLCLNFTIFDTRLKRIPVWRVCVVNKTKAQLMPSKVGITPRVAHKDVQNFYR